ncbi:hypothetical protein [Allobaculum sp. Allo2]|uniref:hypothetical protein n=1 Tax=Allobaculum sp. Allo2 TaxID=2853432 RepID=UPI001F61DE65|nr:hypothetical protein [Allobaculum sp. Allo2]
MKKTVSIALSALLACGIAGCSSAPAETSSKADASSTAAKADAKEILIGISPTIRLMNPRIPATRSSVLTRI